MHFMAQIILADDTSESLSSTLYMQHTDWQFDQPASIRHELVSQTIYSDKYSANDALFPICSTLKLIGIRWAVA